MQLSEWQAKGILRGFGVETPRGALCSTEEEVRVAVRSLGPEVVVKAQVREWRRGARGLVVRANGAEEASAAWVAIQAALRSGTAASDGAACLVEEAVDAAGEVYLCELVDSELRQRAILASRHGGQGVEAGADDMVRLAIPVECPVAAYQVRRISRVWDLEGHPQLPIASVIVGLHETFLREECRLIEINPLAWTEDGRLVALDAKMIIDDNAAARRAQVMEAARGLISTSVEARLRLEHRIEYVGLDGDVGLISGGAGMTMAAIDLIAQAGGRPRCFLDCSQNPTKAGYGAALQHLLADSRTKVILVNIVGGGTAVDEVAPIFVELLGGKDLGKEVLIRLEGTGAERARAILKSAHLQCWEDLEEMVSTAVVAEPARL